jgi:hypothetical protein
MLIPLGILASSASLDFPAGITGLVARYDAQNLASISLSGSQVTQWNDLSANLSHATQGTAVNRPLSGTRTINGKNAIDFDGSNDFLINNAVATSFTGEDKPFTVFVCVDRDASSNSTWMFGRSTSGTPYLWQYFDNVQIRDDSNSTSTIAITNSSTSGAKIVTYRSTGLNFTGYINKTLVNTGTAYNRGAITLDISTIGAYRTSAATDFYLNGAIGEIIYYNRELTITEVGQVQDYMMARWGL